MNREKDLGFLQQERTTLGCPISYEYDRIGEDKMKVKKRSGKCDTGAKVWPYLWNIKKELLSKKHGKTQKLKCTKP